MIDKSLLKALFPGTVLTLLLVTCTFAVFVPVILARLVWLILGDIINKLKN